MAKLSFMEKDSPLLEAGELLALEAVDQTGLAITSEGALVRAIHVIPPNPLILSPNDCQNMIAGFGHMLARLRPGQSVQFYCHATPVNLDEVLTEARTEVTKAAGPPPSEDRKPPDARSLSRWKLYGALEDSMRRHAEQQAAVRFDCYVIVPFVPDHQAAGNILRSYLSRSRLPTGALAQTPDAHMRAARASLAHTELLRSELDALGLPTHRLNGAEFVELLYRRFNPTSSDRARRRPAPVEILGSLDEITDEADAVARATELREAIASSALDFEHKRHAVIDSDLEQVIYASSTADATYFGWLFQAMLTREPFSLSVFVRALDRRSERQRVRMAARRTFAINRGAEARGRPPDFDRYAQEEEQQTLLREMAGHERTNLYDLSIYQAIRVRGPDPDVAELAEAVDYCAEQISSSSDARVNRGEFQQQLLWQTSLPLGRDLAGRTRKPVGHPGRLSGPAGEDRLPARPALGAAG